MVGDNTKDSRALTICRETGSGVDSVWQEVMVCATKSTREGRGILVWEAPAAFRPAGEGEGGGDAYALALSSSVKNE